MSRGGYPIGSGSGGGSGVDQTARDSANARIKAITSRSVQTANFTAAPQTMYAVDATAGTVVVTLPATNTATDLIVIQKTDSTTNLVTYTGTVNGTVNFTGSVRTQSQGKMLQGDGSGNWNILSGDISVSALDTRYLSALVTKNVTAAPSPAVAGNYYLVNGAAPVTVTLPTSTPGQTIGVMQVAASPTVNTVTIMGTINGVANAGIVLLIANEGKMLQADGTGGWTVISSNYGRTGLDNRYLQTVNNRVRRQVAGRSSFPSSARLVSNTNSYTMVQQLMNFVLTDDVEDLAFTWQNAYRSGAGATDMSGTSAITIRAALWDGTNTYPMFFRGSRTLSLDPAGIATSDPIPFRGIKGQRLIICYLITWAVAPANFPGGCTIGDGPTDVNEWGTPTAGGAGGSGVSDRTSNVGYWYVKQVGPANILPPIAITATGAKRPVVAIFGDSIASDGVNDYTATGGDNDFGWAAGGLGDAGIPYIQFGTSSLQMQQISGSVIHRNHLFKGLIAAGVTHILIALGTNDWANARTGAQVYADMQTIRNEASLLGIKVIVCTVQPKTNSANTAVDGPTSGNRPALNALIRANNGVGDGYYDLAAATQSTTNTDLWRTDIQKPGAVTVAAGGSGYVGDETLILPGGTNVGVGSVDGNGAVTSVSSIVGYGGYVAQPTGAIAPVRAIGAQPTPSHPLPIGTGATFTLGTWTTPVPTTDGVHPNTQLTRYLRSQLMAAAPALFTV